MSLNPIARRRIDALLTPEELASKVGVSTQTIYNVEGGTRPRIATLRKLAEFFDCAPSDLLEDSPSPNEVG